jgi:signal transduction histidine kinase
MKATIFKKIKKTFLVSALVMYFFVSLAVFLSQTEGYRHFIIHNLKVNAQLIAYNCSAALLLMDKNSTEEILKSFSEIDEIEKAVIFTPDKKIFAEFVKKNIDINAPENIKEMSYNFKKSYFDLIYPIYFKNDYLGSLYIISDISAFYNDLALKLISILLIFILSIYLSYKYFSKLSKAILKPISYLNTSMKQISKSKNYETRIYYNEDDEFKILCDCFNEMSEIIQKHTESLENEVQERIKELKHAQAQLMHSNKLASLGEMATGIAHEINQPLSIIKFISQSIVFKSEEGIRPKLDMNVHYDLLKIEMQVERIKGIIDHLRVFARKSENLNIEIFDLKTALEETFMFVEQQFKNIGIKIEMILPMDKILVKADKLQIEQVFLNLITNAKDAMSKINGAEEKKIIIETKICDNDIIEIRFSDTGVGIPEDIRDKIFEPFFTTKDIGQGTGLGLSISYGIIKEAGGEINFEVNEGAGTTFIIKLPKA